MKFYEDERFNLKRFVDDFNYKRKQSILAKICLIGFLVCFFSIFIYTAIAADEVQINVFLTLFFSSFGFIILNSFFESIKRKGLLITLYNLVVHGAFIGAICYTAFATASNDGFYFPLILKILMGYMAYNFISGVVYEIFRFKKIQKLKENCTMVVDAVCLDLKRKSTGNKQHRSYIYSPVFGFIHNGERYICENNIYKRQFGEMQEYKFYEIYVNPNNPKEYYIEGFDFNLKFSILSMGFGYIMIFGALLVMLFKI